MTVEPKVPGTGRTPDLHLAEAGATAYVEATTSFSGLKTNDRKAARRAWILDALSDARHPNFTVWVEFEKTGSERGRAEEATRPVLDWLDSLDADEAIRDYGGSRELPSSPSIAIRDSVIVCKAIPVKPGARHRTDRRLLGIGPTFSGWIDDRSHLLRKLRDKRRQHRLLDQPYIVAVMSMSFTTDAVDIIAALFGSEAYQFPAERPEEGRLVRLRDGFWVTERGAGATRVSAVLIGKQIHPWTVTTSLPELWINPGAKVPLDLDLPFAAVCLQPDGSLERSPASVEPYALFGLPAEWPGPEPPFSRDSL